MLLHTGSYKRVGRHGCSHHRMLLLRTGRCQLGSDGSSPHRMLLRTGRYRVGSDGCSPHRMLLQYGRYQVGRDGCSHHRMLLEIGRDQVGSDGCSPHRWHGWMLAPSEASRNRTLPGWQTCSPHHMLVMQKPDVISGLASMAARPIGCFEEPVRKLVGRDGCSPHRMLLGTGRYQVGRDGCSPHRMLLEAGR